MKLSVKCLLFDYGGTIDTNGVHWGEALWETYTLYNSGVSREKFRDAYQQTERQLGSQSLILPNHTFKETLEIKVSLQFEALEIVNPCLFQQITATCYENTCHCIRRASGVLEQLKERYPMYLVSNFYGNLRTVLHEFNLTDYFQVVIESAETGFRKPDPELFRIALNMTGCRPEKVVVIGDSYKNDILPASKLGCPSIWLKVKGWNSEDESIEHPCIIEDFSELTEILLHLQKNNA